MDQDLVFTNNKASNPMEEDISSLFEELRLANQWHRPSILLVAYHSKLALLDAQNQLRKKLLKIKQSIFPIAVTEKNYDIPLFASNFPKRDRTVFFVTGLQNGAGPTSQNAYRALNIRRELLVDYQIRIVFWLSEEEADVLPMKALDFWSFRHRMIEVNDQPSLPRIKTLIKSLDWPDWKEKNLSEEIPEGINLRQELLGEIPDLQVTAEIRAEIIHMLAGLFWAKKEFSKAEQLLKSGLAIIQKYSLHNLDARYFTATGLVALSMGNPTQAIEASQSSIKIDPSCASAWKNLGKAYQILGLFTESIAATKQSTVLDPKDASQWQNLGDMYLRLSQYDEAIEAYQNSLAIDAKDAILWTKLGDIFRKLNRPVDALNPYRKAKNINPNDIDICFQLGLILRDIGLFNNAIRVLYKTSRLNPLFSEPWKILGEIYLNQNRKKYARKAYKTAMHIDPQDKALVIALDSCYVHKNKPDMGRPTDQ